MAEILLKLALNNNRAIKPNNVQHTGTGYRTISVATIHRSRLVLFFLYTDDGFTLMSHIALFFLKIYCDSFKSVI
jgi:hypothetical protein